MNKDVIEEEEETIFFFFILLQLHPCIRLITLTYSSVLPEYNNTTILHISGCVGRLYNYFTSPFAIYSWRQYVRACVCLIISIKSNSIGFIDLSQYFSLLPKKHRPKERRLNNVRILTAGVYQLVAHDPLATIKSGTGVQYIQHNQ